MTRLNPRDRCFMELIKGAYGAEEYADAIDELRATGLQPGLSIGWTSFRNVYTIPKGQWSVITGLSSSGKSSWLDNVMVNMAMEHGWKFLICSPENQPIQRHIAGLMEIYTGKKFGLPDPKYPGLPATVYMTEDEHREGYAFVCDHFYFINPPETEFTIEGIKKIASKVYDEYFKFDGMVLDPYNEIEHKRPRGMNESDYIATVLHTFRDFARLLNIHFWFVAHPTKPVRLAVKYQKNDLNDESVRKPVYQKITLFDISGSSNWKSQCDFGVIVHRDLGDSSAPSIIEIEKIRFRENGKQGTSVPLYYDFLCGRFVEDVDDLLINRRR